MHWACVRSPHHVRRLQKRPHPSRCDFASYTPVYVLAGIRVGGAYPIRMGSVAEVRAREAVRYIGERAAMMAGIVLPMRFQCLSFNSTKVM